MRIRIQLCTDGGLHVQLKNGNSGSGLRPYRVLAVSMDADELDSGQSERMAGEPLHARAEEVSRVERRPVFFIHAACITSSFEVS